MSVPPILVNASRHVWNKGWKILMNGLAPSDSNGNYKRPKNNQKQIQIPSKEDLKNRTLNQMPGLIIGKSCPWAHRAWMIYEIKGLKKSINLYIAEVDNSGGRWILDPPIQGCKTLKDLYKKCGKNESTRSTVPMLFEQGNELESKPRIINNESAELVEILNSWPISDNEIDLNPVRYKEQIINWQNVIQENVNNGVYKCGFARNQTAYDKASKNLFSALDIIEKHLELNGPLLCGKDISIADIRLFPTLIRWEAIYQPLFKCSNKSISAFPKIIEWRKKVFNMYNIKKTCDVDTWRKDYFGALFPLNPSNIIPSGENIVSIINN